jgi:hypothetical protein
MTSWTITGWFRFKLTPWPPICWRYFGPSRRSYSRRAFRWVWFIGPLEIERLLPGHREGCWDWQWNDSQHRTERLCNCFEKALEEPSHAH